VKEGGDGSVGRAMALLEYFDLVQRPLGVAEVSEHFALPRSSTAALFSTLVRLGYLSHDRASRSYLPTLRVSELGRWVDKVLFGEDRATVVPFLVHVGKEVHETVVLGVQDDLFAQYVHVELPDRPVLYLVKGGALRPVCRSAVGWALLSTRSAEEIAHLVRRHNALPDNRERRVDPAELTRTLAEIRERGYAYSRHAYLPGIGMIAMLLPALPGRRQLAVGVGGPVERLDPKEAQIVRTLKEGMAAFLTPAPTAREAVRVEKRRRGGGRST
jgi:IclR family transcriptional regulator, KDG regulon repressor